MRVCNVFFNYTLDNLKQGFNPASNLKKNIMRKYSSPLRRGADSTNLQNVYRCVTYFKVMLLVWAKTNKNKNQAFTSNTEKS